MRRRSPRCTTTCFSPTWRRSCPTSATPASSAGSPSSSPRETTACGGRMTGLGVATRSRGRHQRDPVRRQGRVGAGRPAVRRHRVARRRDGRDSARRCGDVDFAVALEHAERFRAYAERAGTAFGFDFCLTRRSRRGLRRVPRARRRLGRRRAGDQRERARARPAAARRTPSWRQCSPTSRARTDALDHAHPQPGDVGRGGGPGTGASSPSAAPGPTSPSANPSSSGATSSISNSAERGHLHRGQGRTPVPGSSDGHTAVRSSVAEGRRRSPVQALDGGRAASLGEHADGAVGPTSTSSSAAPSSPTIDSSPPSSTGRPTASSTRPSSPRAMPLGVRSALCSASSAAPAPGEPSPSWPRTALRPRSARRGSEGQARRPWPARGSSRCATPRSRRCTSTPVAGSPPAARHPGSLGHIRADTQTFWPF